ncbi:MAG: hypothetical protein HYX79_10835 [Chloroflexi bacterium]|nr:hypothetical protein [Chloroflexota bacterium]
MAGTAKERVNTRCQIYFATQSPADLQDFLPMGKLGSRIMKGTRYMAVRWSGTKPMEWHIPICRTAERPGHRKLAEDMQQGC